MCFYSIYSFFVQTVEGNANIVKVQFQEGRAVVVLEKNTMMGTLSAAVVRDVWGAGRIGFRKD
ncbi:Uncharacterised protein [Bartonella doshiae]|uniref:Uncharacterized protein n=2 Tax=Bartonella doshiae TaxID=33044 RepID=A0A380ZFM7_BARDO|nr:hypothetical protein MCS_00912 [Bartonella doshiae NCTC 12862 = ATCC 700133]SUV45350.1 Uncharacterised protein [Bartonella doshiae]